MSFIFSLLSTVHTYAWNHPALTVLFCLLIPLILYLLANEYVRAASRIPGFPGPIGYPVVGNILQTRRNASEKYRQWSKQYGPVFQVQLGNIPVLVVNSASAAHQIFVANSHATNSRPMFYTFHSVVSATAGFTIGTSPYSESLKHRRKAAASALNRPAVQSYMPIVDLEIKEFVKDAFEFGSKGRVPIDPLPLIQRLSLNLSLTLNWGTRIDSVLDPLFAEITEVEEYISKFRSTTGNWQDYIPILRLNPFNHHSAVARDMRARRDVYINKLNEDLEHRMANNDFKPCIQANVLLDPDTQLTPIELKSISLSMVAGGLDTITTLVSWALPLLASRPDIQKNAYRAIRAMFQARDVLCDPNDDQKCVYVLALVRELLRLYTPLRLALPRVSSEDFYYENKRIPKGTVLFLNAWACNTDPEVWDDPEVFRPERFIDSRGTAIFTYGQGSRMCAGYLLGNRELYLLFMRLISAFEIKSDKYDDKFDTNPLTGISDPSSLVSTPQRYKIFLRPRNPAILEAALSSSSSS
ncbi:cytochrome P450 [Lipomyces arxii]|uniref:cytochrome P450 n=1 Tax=Lipomyces arxii TaxID=56418 RepID=UPI0034CDB08B